MKKEKIIFIDSLGNDFAAVIFNHIKGYIGSEYEFVSLNVKKDLPDVAKINDWLRSENIKGIIFSGSMSSVNDDEPWVHKLLGLAKQILEPETDDVAILGCCFGHQLFAKSAGGNVNTYSVLHKGIKSLNVVTENPIFKAPSGNLECFSYHNDVVESLPDDFELLLTSEEVKIYGMKHKTKSIFCIQGHPEAPFPVVNTFDESVTADRYPKSDNDNILSAFSSYLLKSKSTEAYKNVAN